MKTFLHHDGALGDVLLSLPILRAIRNDSTLLHFAGRADIGDLLRECRLVDTASSSGSSRYAPLYTGEIDADVSAFLRTFDRAFLFTVNGYSAIASSLRAAIPRTETIITIPPGPGDGHISDFRMKQAGHPAPSLDDRALKVPLQFGVSAEVLLQSFGYDGFSPVLSVHPGSGGATKNWPLERFFDLIERLKKSFEPFVLLMTGPGECDALKGQVEEFLRKQAGMAHVSGADLTAVAALLARSGLFIGNDSGVGHLAASVGCPVLSLFGPTDPGRWAPRGSRVEVISASALAELDVDRVYSPAASLFLAGRS